ncbi:hypothetical protein SAMN06273572_102305 [Monaibacterium marinum]|uniref:Uncharacterized protein n=1 Tax=Pontivivens marinum TaxID=1690039 RepID=A0A2C9CQZ7_9RHOB|nr:hypothetical protein [Monaibacterium marinum]SOH93628.1 hypothetical protein SAMN06273572_102305 [Monaibacterium marinum]
MGKVIFYIFVLLLLIAAGFAVYSVVVPPQAPIAPVEVQIDLQSGS